MKTQSSKSAGNEAPVRAWDQSGKFWVEFDPVTSAVKYFDTDGAEINKPSAQTGDFQYAFEPTSSGSAYKFIDHGHWVEVFSQSKSGNNGWNAMNSEPPNPNANPGDGTLRNYDPDMSSPTQMGFFSGVSYPNNGPKAIAADNPHDAENFTRQGFPRSIVDGNGVRHFFDGMRSTTAVDIVPDNSEGFVLPTTPKTLLTNVSATAGKTFYKDLGGNRHLFVAVINSQQSVKAAILDFSAGCPQNVSLNTLLSGQSFGQRAVDIIDNPSVEKLLIVVGGYSAVPGINTIFIDYSGAAPVVSGTPGYKNGAGALEGWLGFEDPACWALFETADANEFLLFASNRVWNYASSTNLHLVGGNVDWANDQVTWTVKPNSSGNSPFDVAQGHGFGLLPIGDDKFFVLQQSGTNLYAKIYDAQNNVQFGYRSIGNVNGNLTSTNGWTSWGYQLNDTDLIFVLAQELVKVRLKQDKTDFDYWPIIEHGTHISAYDYHPLKNPQSFHEGDPTKPTILNMHAMYKLEI